MNCLYIGTHSELVFFLGGGGIINNNENGRAPCSEFIDI